MTTPPSRRKSCGARLARSQSTSTRARSRFAPDQVPVPRSPTPTTNAAHRRRPPTPSTNAARFALHCDANAPFNGSQSRCGGGGGLAAAGFSHQPQGFTSFDAEVDAIHRFDQRNILIEEKSFRNREVHLQPLDF